MSFREKEVDNWELLFTFSSKKGKGGGKKK